MTLNDYLKLAQMKDGQFASLVGADRSTVARLRAGQIPGKELMVEIVRATNGAVTANDFYGIAA